jgi:undecaprenyl diphosphate synthase
MGLLRRYLRTELNKMMKNEVRVVAIGDTARLPDAVREELELAIEKTRDNTRLMVGLCVSYGGREDILRAARSLAHAAQQGTLNPDDIDEQAFANRLGTAGMPDPDLLIRTSGEMRLSNFYLWQSAYTEIYVTDTLWPDFREKQFLEALAHFQKRERRFGRVSERDEKERLSVAR